MSDGNKDRDDGCLPFWTTFAAIAFVVPVIICVVRRYVRAANYRADVYQDLFDAAVAGFVAVPAFIAMSLGAFVWITNIYSSSAPPLGRRFSLRSLLVVMTLVAVVLGLAVWAVRK